jgi:hypothetical protein
MRNVICDVSLLIELINNIAKTCPRCNGKLEVKSQSIKGLALQLSLGCQCNPSSFVWSTSTMLSTQTYLVNQLIPVSALISGLGPKRTIDFLELLKLGSLSREHFRNVYNSFHTQVQTAKHVSLERAIKRCNELRIDIHLQVDEQYSRPQRWFGPAPHVTTTVIETTTEKIIAIEHAHKSVDGNKQEGSLCKFSTQKALQTAAEKLNNISEVTTDCGPTISKIIQTVFQKDGKHKKVIYSKDIWQISKNIPTKWNRFLIKKKKTAAKNKEYSNIDEDSNFVDSTKLKTHFWYWATQKLPPNKFKEKLCQATNYWKTRMKLNDTQSQLVNEFFEELVGENPECYSNGSSTALCESLHNVNNIYCPKGEKYSNSIYETRKDLALLDWNFRKEKIHPME